MKNIFLQLLLFISFQSFSQIKVQVGSSSSGVSPTILNTKQQNLGWVNVMDYGADSTGATDNFAAFTAAQSALGSYGTLYIPHGSYLFTQTFTINKYIIIRGDGMGKFAGGHSATKIFCNTNIDLWKLTAAGVQITDVGFEYTNTTAATSARGLWIYNTDTDTTFNMSDKSQKFILRNVSVRAFYTNIYIEKGAYWTMDNVDNINPASVGLHIENTTIQDAGDWTISNCFFMQPMSTPGGTAISQSGSGGGKIVNTKFNGAFQTCYSVDFSGRSSILIISNCSFENFTKSAVIASNANFIKIDGCQIAPYHSITGLGVVYYYNVNGGVISDNVFVGNLSEDKLAILVSGTSTNVGICGNVFPNFNSLTPYTITTGTGNYICGQKGLIGASAPASTPIYVGQSFTDSVNKKYYIATGTASSSDWTIQN